MNRNQKEDMHAYKFFIYQSQNFEIKFYINKEAFNQRIVINI